MNTFSLTHSVTAVIEGDICITLELFTEVCTIIVMDFTLYFTGPNLWQLSILFYSFIDDQQQMVIHFQ